jgi:polyferredoxin
MNKDFLKLFSIIAVIFLGLLGLMSLMWKFFGEMVFLNFAVVVIIIYFIFAFTIFAKSTLPNKTK